MHALTPQDTHTPVRPYLHTLIHTCTHTHIHSHSHAPIVPYTHTPLHHTPLHPNLNNPDNPNNPASTPAVHPCGSGVRLVLCLTVFVCDPLTARDRDTVAMSIAWRSAPMASWWRRGPMTRPCASAKCRTGRWCAKSRCAIRPGAVFVLLCYVTVVLWFGTPYP